jgi:hypothetical protein
MSASSKLITIIGGSGFLGPPYHPRACAPRPPHPHCRAPAGPRRPPAADRLSRPDHAGAVQPALSGLGGAACAGADVVINLVGVLFSSGGQSFDALHDQGARAVAEAKPQRRQGQPVHPDVRHWRRSRIASGAYAPHQGDGRAAGVFESCPARSSCGHPSCSARKTISSTSSPPWPGCRRHCR